MKHPKATSVHQLRPEDIKVIASLGDSLTSANGAMAYSEEEMKLNYRGVSAMGGKTFFLIISSLFNAFLIEKL